MQKRLQILKVKKEEVIDHFDFLNEKKLKARSKRVKHLT